LLGSKGMRSNEASINIPFNPVLGTFLQRLNRFMTLVEINRERTFAHLPNSGRLTTVLSPGAVAYLRTQPAHPRRRSRFDLFAVQCSGVTTIVDAQFSNFLAKAAFEHDLFDMLAGYRVAKRNVKVNGARLDLMLEKDSNKFFLEVKSVTNVVNGVALFPDAPTIRGRKHIQHLIALSKGGFNAAILFSVQRPDSKMLKPNSQVDPQFAESLKEAVRKNVKIFILNSVFTPPNIVKLKPNTPIFRF